MRAHFPPFDSPPGERDQGAIEKRLIAIYGDKARRIIAAHHATIDAYKAERAMERDDAGPEWEYAGCVSRDILARLQRESREG